MKFGLPITVIKSLNDIFKSYPQIEKVILYGSRAKGNFRPGSDIDLNLVAPELNTGNILEIETKIEDLNLPYRVDLSIKGTLENQQLLDHIERVGVIFAL